MVDTSSYIEMLRKFGSDLGLPKMNVDQLVETQKKNIDALGLSAKVAAKGAQSMVQKQREVPDAGLWDGATLEIARSSDEIIATRPMLRRSNRVVALDGRPRRK